MNLSPDSAPVSHLPLVAARGGEEKKKKGYLGKPHTPAKGSLPFAIPLEKPYVRTYGDVIPWPLPPPARVAGNFSNEASQNTRFLDR
ncbi:hypothetical protein [Dictyobacter arantiisoli]|uniref:Uncharacterized protein n=1 Tax=Dictyobacter arantiisoli TaxID=2014874 RepID=A0A5A5T8U4_9CHLR|nr:hypothetical protein [Dictyobacter arantiisoli]GCF07901.1 hypothetical protein KDI_14650 [Dictyobacter arantiisoli]